MNRDVADKKGTVAGPRAGLKRGCTTQRVLPVNLLELRLYGRSRTAATLHPTAYTTVMRKFGGGAGGCAHGNQAVWSGVVGGGV